ncbi:MAG TPA: hypothetical protein VL134_10330 [Leptolyngbya sp.]|nr:hypothetical protein [Leptolyngbya sp.]
MAIITEAFIVCHHIQYRIDAQNYPITEAFGSGSLRCITSHNFSQIGDRISQKGTSNSQIGHTM